MSRSGMILDSSPTRAGRADCGSEPMKPKSEMLTTEWLTASEAARYFRVEARTVLLWVRQGKIKGYALSGTKRHVWRFRRADLDAALLDQTAVVNCDPLSVRSSQRRAK